MTTIQSSSGQSIELFGHGTVGQAFAHRARAVGRELQSIHNSTQLLEGRLQSSAILVDATSPAYAGERAESWIGFLEKRLQNGTHVVTCNKAPLALAWGRLNNAAVAGNVTLAASATVGAGTPVLSWVRRLRQTHGISHLQATLSGTLSYVVARIAANCSLDEAVREAQALGYAEPDPCLDLDGTDARAKAVLLHNATFGTTMGLQDAGPPLHLDVTRIRELNKPGFQAGVVATIRPRHVRLKLVALPGLAREPGTIHVQAVLSDGKRMELFGPGAGSAATAGALLADLNDVCAGHTSVGVWP